VRIAGEIALRERLDRARVEGDLSATADAAELAGYIATILTRWMICKLSRKRRPP